MNKHNRDSQKQNDTTPDAPKAERVEAVVMPNAVYAVATHYDKETREYRKAKFPAGSRVPVEPHELETKHETLIRSEDWDTLGADGAAEYIRKLSHRAVYATECHRCHNEIAEGARMNAAPNPISGQDHVLTCRKCVVARIARDMNNPNPEAERRRAMKEKQRTGRIESAKRTTEARLKVEREMREEALRQLQG